MYEYVQKVATVTKSVDDSAVVAAFEDISLQEIVCLIRSLKNGKVTVIDMVSFEIIKTVVVLSEILLRSYLLEYRQSVRKLMACGRRAFIQKLEFIYRLLKLQNY